MMKKLTFLLAGILLLCGCQQVLIQPDRVTGIYAQAEFETARTALPQSMQDDVLEVLASLSFDKQKTARQPACASMSKKEMRYCPFIAARTM